jgi:hypothetical protein
MKNKQENNIISGKKHFIIDVSANSVGHFQNENENGQ